MKRKLMRAAALSLALIMLLMSACGGKETDNPAGNDGTQAVETKGEEGTPAASNTPSTPEVTAVMGDVNGQTYPLTDEKITLTMWYPMAGSMAELADFNDGEFWQWYEELTNVHIDFIVPATGTEVEAFRTLFLNDDLPDIMYTIPNQYVYRDGMDAAIEDGYIMNLAEHLDWAPNYVSWFKNVEGAEKDVYTDAGNMYGFWGFWLNMENGYADQGLSIRQDFLDKVGMEVPTTYDEWEAVLTAFKEEFKDVEGFAPFYTSKYGRDNGEFMAGYGVAPYYYQKDGEVLYGPMQEGYKDYLTMMHDWYEKGLLDQDFASRQSSGIAADNDMILNDKIGALIDYGTRMTDAYISRGNANPDVWAVAAPQPKISADSEDPAWYMAGTNYHNMQSTATLIAADSEYAEIATRWVDGFYAAEVFWNANYGIESEEGTVWYKAEDGHRIGDYDFRYSNPDGLSSGMVLVKYWAKNPQVRVEAAQIEQMPAERAAAYPIWSQYAPVNYIPDTVTMTTEEGTEFATLNTDIQTYVDEMVVKFIKGDVPLSEYDAFLAELDRLQIDRCIEIKQAALDRYYAR